MERIEVDGHLLGWHRQSDGAVLEVGASGVGGDRRPGTTTFVLRVRDDRLQVDLALLPTSRTVDVTLQPDLFGQVLPMDPGPCADGTAGAVVARWVVTLGAGNRMWCPADPAPADLMAVLGGAALPLLGAAYDTGAATLREVPRWATPLLAGSTPRAAARSGFGTKGTKTVARALIDGLVVPPHRPPEGVSRVGPVPPTGHVALHRVAVALMGASALDPDRIARVLLAGGPPPDPLRWPGGDQIATGHAIASRLGSAQAERVLTDALATDGGLAALEEVCRLYPGVADQLPARIPSRLLAVRDLCRSLLPIDPDPSAARFGRPPGSPTSRMAVTRTMPRRVHRPRSGGVPASASVVAPPLARPARAPAPAPDPRTRARVAPAAPPALANAALRYPPAVAGLHGAEVGADLRLLLPRTSDELLAWGRLLRSCIGSFGAAAASGRSMLIGVEERGALAYCMEVAPDGSVRQFLGERNRPVPRSVVASVCDRLVLSGVLVRDLVANQVWLEA